MYDYSLKNLCYMENIFVFSFLIHARLDSWSLLFLRLSVTQNLKHQKVAYFRHCM